ncbi:hypothetical protein Daus18300_013327 [Diaporthe australafricana]|uniref:Peptidase A1 domain-containing protein n=1 Tax=Diaporthe australafricana TaxID=127596 RepID=A0ABR3VZI8_9PEZI
MASSKLLAVSLVMLADALGVSGHHPHPPRSAPATEIREDIGATFRVQQMKNPGFKGKSGLEAMIDVYKKYGVELTPQLKKAVQVNPQLAVAHKRQTVTATPPPGLDIEYVSPVQIGTPAQTLFLNFDTGSSDLWCFSTDTNSSEVNGQGLYVPSDSTTSVVQAGSTFSIGYGDGSGAAGVVYNDVVSVAGFVATNQAVESALTVSTQFTEDPYSWGLLGLGMSGGNTVRPVPQLTFFDNIKASLAAPVFTADLKAAAPGSHGFGFIGNSFTGNIQYAPIDRTSQYWKFAITGYRVGPATVPGNPNSGYTTKPLLAIADTGTTLLLLPDDIVNAYWSTVTGAAFDADWAAILFPCTATLPDFTFGIGLYKGVVPGRYINYGRADETRCYGGLQTQGNMGFGIVGDIALKAQFAIFDQGNMKVGLANKVLTT